MKISYYLYLDNQYQGTFNSVDIAYDLVTFFERKGFTVQLLGRFESSSEIKSELLYDTSEPFVCLKEQCLIVKKKGT